MKRFLINFTEVSFGVIEVFAETEEEAREIAECEGQRFVDDSKLELKDIHSVEDIDEY